MALKIGSLFDGIGGFPQAAIKAGMIPVWASEIEEFPIAVTKLRIPDMKHLGDVTKINGAEIEPVDVITFGSPCQDLSVAGKREGMAYKCSDCEHKWEYSTTYGIDTNCPNCGSENIDLTRSNLFTHATRIIREMRCATDGRYPTYAVWENVPGAFSSNRGRNFRAVISELIGCEVPMPNSGQWANSGMVRGNGCSLAWRVFDAQYWGVPQRRRRIYVVVDFGEQSAPEILFEPEGMPGDTQESGAEGQGVAASVENGIADNAPMLDECIPPLQTTSQMAVAFPRVANPLLAKGNFSYRMDMDNVVVHPQINGTLCASGAGMSRPAGMASETDLVVAIQHSIIGRNDNAGPAGPGYREDNKMFTLDSRGAAHAVATVDCRNMNENHELSGTLQSKSTGGYSLNYQNPVRIGYAVRRLTPLECERLQGLPDGYTDIPGAKDTPRYKAIGNGLAQPCPDWILARLKKWLDKRLLPQ